MYNAYSIIALRRILCRLLSGDEIFLLLLWLVTQTSAQGYSFVWAEFFCVWLSMWFYFFCDCQDNCGFYAL